MKKLIAVCLSALLCAALLAGCGGGLSMLTMKTRLFHWHMRLSPT